MVESYNSHYDLSDTLLGSKLMTTYLTIDQASPLCMARRWHTISVNSAGF